MQVVQSGLIFSLVCAVGAVLYGIVSRNWILSLPSGNDRMREIAAAIQQGAQAYLKRQYTTIAVVGVVLFLIIGFTPAAGLDHGGGVPDRRRAVGAVRLHRHERVGARQRAHRGSRAHGT